MGQMHWSQEQMNPEACTSTKTFVVECQYLSVFEVLSWASCRMSKPKNKLSPAVIRLL